MWITLAVLTGLAVAMTGVALVRWMNRREAQSARLNSGSYLSDAGADDVDDDGSLFSTTADWLAERVDAIADEPQHADGHDRDGNHQQEADLHHDHGHHDRGYGDGGGHGH